MDLLEYRWRRNVPYTVLARKVGCTSHHLNRIALKKYKPGFELAHKIEKATNGDVTANELRNDENYPPRYVVNYEGK